MIKIRLRKDLQMINRLRMLGLTNDSEKIKNW